MCSSLRICKQKVAFEWKSQAAGKFCAVSCDSNRPCNSLVDTSMPLTCHLHKLDVLRPNNIASKLTTSSSNSSTSCFKFLCISRLCSFLCRHSQLQKTSSKLTRKVASHHRVKCLRDKNIVPCFLPVVPKAKPRRRQRPLQLLPNTS